VLHIQCHKSRLLTVDALDLWCRYPLIAFCRLPRPWPLLQINQRCLFFDLQLQAYSTISRLPASAGILDSFTASMYPRVRRGQDEER
jgi:hypothetical protein